MLLLSRVRVHELLRLNCKTGVRSMYIQKLRVQLGTRETVLHSAAMVFLRFHTLVKGCICDYLTKAPSICGVIQDSRAFYFCIVYSIL